MRLMRNCFLSTLLLFVIVGCAHLPEEMQHETPLQIHSSTSTLATLASSSKPHFFEDDNSAVVIQNSGWDALAQRLALVETAEHSIDIQYYIWNSDASGHYLASRLLAAADRGVQIRVMLDDINLNEREDLLIALDNHPNVNIRVFNPIPTRRGVSKWLNLLGDFSRLNRRMHNKSFTVDGVFSIVGGRNIGDEYFDLSDEINFRDRDALVIGEVVDDIQTSFIEYWGSRWSYPVELLGDTSTSDLYIVRNVTVPAYASYPPLPQDHNQAKRYLDGLMDNFTWVEASFAYDNPVPKDVNNSDEPKATAKLLGQMMYESDEEVIVESAYLVFDDSQLTAFQELIDTGSTLKALTNSMASNDLVTNHSAYAGRRKDMLEHGIELYELKPDSALCQASIKDENLCAPHVAYGLHAKSVVFDREAVGIGSFNFNLRSTYLNTESILIVKNEQIAEALAEDIENAMNTQNSWQLKLEDSAVHWYSDGKVWSNEPETGQWERAQSYFLQLLPIEKYL